jgi:WD40 repeat protein
MKQPVYAVLTLLLAPAAFAQEASPAKSSVAKPFPPPDFILRDKDVKPSKGGMVMGPAKSDGKGHTSGSFAIYSGLMLDLSSLSFSGDGKILAVGSTPGRIDLWDVEKRKKLRTLEGGTTVALNASGTVLAKDGNGIELYDVATGRLLGRIPWTVMTSQPGVQHTVDNLTFNADGTLLNVTANGMVDSVYEVASGQLKATLTNTQHAQFAPDGGSLVGGNAKHLVIWETKGWTQLSDLPNGPDYVRRIAVFPSKDLLVVGGAKAARLLRLSNGQELANVGLGYVNFAAFNETGTLIFTYASPSFGVWDISGKLYCSAAGLGNGVFAVSSDGRWMASAAETGTNSVKVWSVQSALAACDISSTKSP